jgi:hypothetical protein
MPVAVIMEFNGATLEQYDQVIGKMGLTEGGPAPAGALSHWVAGTDYGILVTELCPSKPSSGRTVSWKGRDAERLRTVIEHLLPGNLGKKCGYSPVLAVDRPGSEHLEDLGHPRHRRRELLEVVERIGVIHPYPRSTARHLNFID